MARKVLAGYPVWYCRYNLVSHPLRGVLSAVGSGQPQLSLYWRIYRGVCMQLFPHHFLYIPFSPFIGQCCRFQFQPCRQLFIGDWAAELLSLDGGRRTNCSHIGNDNRSAYQFSYSSFCLYSPEKGRKRIPS